MQIEVDATDLIHALAQIEARASDWRSHAPKLHGILQSDIEDRFASAPGVRQTATVHGGALWESLSDRYLARRPDREGGRQLIDTTALKESFQVGDAHNIATASATELEFGSDVIYAAAQDRRRPIAFFHEDLVSALCDSVGDYVLGVEK